MDLQKRRFALLFCLGLLAAGSFYFISTVLAISPGDVQIYEVQTTGGPGKTDEDFVRLYNVSQTAIDLKGLRLVKRTKSGATDTTIKSWTKSEMIQPLASYLWANSANGFAASINADAATTQTLADDNGLAVRQGAENSGTIIDSLGWGLCQNIFVQGTAPANPGPGQTLKRVSYTGNNVTDFILFGQAINLLTDSTPSTSSASSPQAGSVSTTSSMDATTNSSTDNSAATTTGADDNSALMVPKFRAGDVVINELVSDPGDGDTEWLELYNNCAQTIDLTGWLIQDGSGAKTSLSGALDNGDNRYLVVRNPKGNLNNDGDQISLFARGGDLLDQVTYGIWPGSDAKNNAPAVRNPDGIARIFDGHDTFNNAADFAETTKLTPGAANQIVAPVGEDEISPADRALYDYNSGVVINELLPNPVGLDNPATTTAGLSAEALAKAGEFIELFNHSNKDINLLGWKLDNGHKTFKFSTSTVIKAQDFFVLWRAQSKIVLPNGAGQINLTQPLKDAPLQSVKYNNVDEGFSYDLLNASSSLANQNNWAVSQTPTPGTSNVIKTLNHQPKAEFDVATKIMLDEPAVFDSSDSEDPDNDVLTYAWQFGDGATSTEVNPAHFYNQSGAYNVKLIVSDGQATDSKTRTVKVVALPAEDSLLDTPLVAKTIKAIAGKKIIKTPSTPSTSSGRASSATVTINYRGAMAVLPGQFSKQFAYFLPVDADGSLAPAIQLYNYHEQFPALSLGQVVAVSGVYSELAAGPRLKISALTAIKPLAQKINLKPATTTTDKIDETMAGQLIKVSGEVTAKSGYQLYLDDGEGEIAVYEKKSAKITTTLVKGDHATITGLLLNTDSGLKLLPRQTSDVVKFNLPGSTDDSGFNLQPLSSNTPAAATADDN